MAPLHSTRGRLSPDVLAGPADFDAFWRAAFDEAVSVEPDPRRVRPRREAEGWRLSEVRLSSTGSLDIGAFLLEPEQAVERVLVKLPGYGGADGPWSAHRRPGVAELTVMARGMPALSRVQGIPEVPSEHVLHGICARESYVIRGCVQDVWVGVTAARRLFGPDVRVDLVGGSFGGGLGALALPWDDRLTAGVLMVPTFGNHPERLRTPCTGSGESVRLLAARSPGVGEVVRYFDAATAATRIGVPVLVGAARHDPAVPAVGQFAVYEALAGQHVLVELTAGHHDFDGVEREERAFHAATAGWLDL